MDSLNKHRLDNSNRLFTLLQHLVAVQINHHHHTLTHHSTVNGVHLVNPVIFKFTADSIQEYSTRTATVLQAV
jgi:hypothetical protein